MAWKELAGDRYSLRPNRYYCLGCCMHGVLYFQSKNQAFEEKIINAKEL